MRTFKHFPEGSICPVCKTNDDKTTVLLGIAGTEDGNNIEAHPFHLDCLDVTSLIYSKQQNVVYKIL